MPLSEDLSILGQSVKIGTKTAPNRFLVQPMEGFDSDEKGSPGPLTFRRYGRYAKGGSGIIWFEATAVLHEARSNPGQLHLWEETLDVFKDLVRHTRQTAEKEWNHEVILILQMTHSGRYSKPTGFPEPIIAHHSPILDPKHNLPETYPLVTDEYLDGLQDTFVATAKLAREAGFDGVDVKACHRYLVSELLASFSREGKYGGSFENRTRILRETVKKIQSEVDGIFVTTRMNAYDGIDYPYGFGVAQDDPTQPDLTEPLKLVGILQEMGLPLINITIANPYFNPHYNRPYDFPIKGVPVPDDDPLLGVSRFLEITREIQQTYPDLPVVGSGYSWLRHLMPYVAAGVCSSGGAALIGQGRGSFAYPDSVKDILKEGAMDPNKCCVTCSGCTQIMRDGGRTGCVVRDSEIYGPEYRAGVRFSLVRLQEEAQRCRNCAFATCSRGCPAGVDVPGFIRAFLENDIDRSYAILKESNVLPELCAYVCPSQKQCEGGCLENIFCEDPVAIRDIQRFVARAARLKGIVGVDVPAAPSGKSVAIVGGGPAGIACAIVLIEAGHHVKLYEARNSLGGTPREIVPGYRMSREEAAAEIEAVLAPAREGGRLSILFDSALGIDLSLEDVKKEADAVILAMGLGGALSLGTAEGVLEALSFLADVKADRIERMEGKVAVLGGGNTAIDAAMTAVKLGASDVYLVYRRSFAQMPAWREEVDAYLASGGHLLALTQPVAYETDETGRLTGLRTVRTELGSLDASGRRSPVPISGSEAVLPVQWVIEAVGQRLPDSLLEELRRSGIDLTKKGLIRVDEKTFATNLEGVFAVGDAVNGGTTAVQAIAEGMRAARGGVAAYLMTSSA